MKALTAEQVESRDKMVKALREQGDSPERRQAESDAEFLVGALKEQDFHHKRRIDRLEWIICVQFAVIGVLVLALVYR